MLKADAKDWQARWNSEVPKQVKKYLKAKYQNHIEIISSGVSTAPLQMKQPHLTNVWKFTRCSKLNCNQEIHLKDLKEKGRLDGAIQLYGLDTSSREWWCDANIGQWRCLCVDKAWSQEEKLVWEPNLAASCKNNEVMHALSELIWHILLSNLLGPWCLNISDWPPEHLEHFVFFLPLGRWGTLWVFTFPWQTSSMDALPMSASAHQAPGIWDDFVGVHGVGRLTIFG